MVMPQVTDWLTYLFLGVRHNIILAIASSVTALVSIGSQLQRYNICCYSLYLLDGWIVKDIIWNVKLIDMSEKRIISKRHPE